MQHKKKILVVDDQRNIREMLSNFLDGEGYQSTVAERGEEALALLEKETFDAVLCDIMMPGISGFQALKEVKRRDPLAVVIMISALPVTRPVVEHIEKVGAYGYLYKPFSLDDVKSTLNDALKLGEVTSTGVVNGVKAVEASAKTTSKATHDGNGEDCATAA